MLSQIGCVTVPPDVLDKSYNGQVLNAEEQELLSSQASLGHDMVAKIPRLEVVAKMVANQSNVPMLLPVGTMRAGGHGRIICLLASLKRRDRTCVRPLRLVRKIHAPDSRRKWAWRNRLRFNLRGGT